MFIFVSLLLGLLSLWIYKRRKRMSVFKKLGIDGPQPNLIFGNLIFIKRKGLCNALEIWKTQYGKIFGYFLGGNPVLLIHDTELLKQIEIKDFPAFHNRPEMIPGDSVADDGYDKHIIAEVDGHWKDQRAILTPMFTSGKLKQMAPHLNHSLDVFLSKLDLKSKSGEEFNAYHMYKRLTLDIITRTGFGTETSVQLNTVDPFLKGLQKFIRANPFSGIAFLVTCFPEFANVFVVIRAILKRFAKLLPPSEKMKTIFSCMDIVKARRSNPENRRNDLLQLMLDAEISRSTIKNTLTENLTARSDLEHFETTKLLGTNGVKQKPYSMTNLEVLSNTLLFMQVGYGTTSLTLGYMSNVLISNPEIQDKIREEIRKIEVEDGEIHFNNVNKLKYMDQVLSETLRFYPPVPAVRRAVSRAKKYGNLQINKDITVQVPIKLLHFDKELWKNPKVFDPERFSPENSKNIVPMSYQPFGAGPRNCIGLRFAQMEIKLIMGKILSQYRFVASAKSETEKLAIVDKWVLLTPKNGVWLKVVKI